jgi:hypothetical protein
MTKTSCRSAPIDSVAPPMGKLSGAIEPLTERGDPALENSDNVAKGFPGSE